jgi:hypothetical protein
MEKRYFKYKYVHKKYDGRVFELLNSFFDNYLDEEEKTLYFAGIDQKGDSDFFKYSEVVFINDYKIEK